MLLESDPLLSKAQCPSCERDSLAIIIGYSQEVWCGVRLLAVGVTCGDTAKLKLVGLNT